jgi:hypothetical protein
MIRLVALRLIGPSGCYEVRFDARQSNLAVIAGPISTGKTTIFGFIDYCLGGAEHPTHPEIAKKVRAAALEIAIDGITWTIERPVFSSEQLAWLHRGGLDETSAATVRKTIDAPSVEDSLSAWLMQVAGLEGLRLKVTPGNPNSPTNLMSFRDLMWLCYLQHSRLDNQELLFEHHRYKHYKLQQVIEVLFDVADQRLTDLMEQLARLREEHRELHAEVNSLTAFLDESNTPPREEITARRKATAKQREIIAERLVGLEREMRESTRYADQLRDRYAKARDTSLSAERHMRDRHALVQRLMPLLGQYTEDERKLTFVGEARRLFDPLQVKVCPSCLQRLKQTPKIEHACCTLCGQEITENADDAFDVDLERKAIRERIRDLDRYINTVETEIVQAEHEVQRTRVEVQQLEDGLNSRVSKDLSPFVQTRDSLVREDEQLHGQERSIAQELKWHDALGRRRADLATLEARQQSVGKELAERRGSRPDKAELVENLSERFANLLREWRFPKVDDGGTPRLDDSFVPWVRGRPYREIGSAGASTLIAVAWQLTLFERAIEAGQPHPGFLLIDSPEKNLSPEKVGDTELLDPKIVESMWAHMSMWCRQHTGAQLIVIENTPPPIAGDHMIVHFSRDSNKPPYGLITDEMG